MTTNTKKSKKIKAQTTEDSPLEAPEVPEQPFVGDGQEDTPVIGATADKEARIKKFQQGYQKLVQETQVGVECIITPYGPQANLVDLKEKGNVSTNAAA